MSRIYAHLFVQRGFLGIYPYEIIAKFIEDGNPSFLVEGPEEELKETCRLLPRSHLVETLKLTIKYKSKAKNGKIIKEMSPLGALLFFINLSERRAWEFLRKYYREEYERYKSPIISLVRGTRYKLVLPPDSSSFYCELSDGVYSYRSHSVILL